MMNRIKRAAIVLLALTSGASMVAQEPIHWRSGDARPRRANRQQIEHTLLQVASDPATSHVVVQFNHPVSEQERETLRATGVQLLRYLGSNAFFASIDAAPLQAASIAGSGVLSDVQRIARNWKLHPEIVANRYPEYAMVGGSPEDPTVAAYVLLHADLDVAENLDGLIESFGGMIMDRMETIQGLVVELPLSKVRDLAGHDSVQWVEPPLPRMSGVLLNDSNRAITQSDLVQAGPYNLDGSGVTALIYDAASALASHDDFGGRLTVRDTTGTSFHPTHVAGTVGGSGSASGGTFRGMAPGVTLESYGFEYDGTGIFLYTNPGDIETDYDEAINTYGADVSNNSIGSNTEPNGFPCNIQGDYGACAVLIDNIVRGSLGSPFRIVWSAGNERQGSSCDLEGHGDYYSMAPPAGAKNQLCIGALNSNDDSMTTFSSWGPTDDGRLKPDISGPGCENGNDNGVTSCNSAGNTSYTVACGTSMSGPTLCGMICLLLEDYRIQFGGSDPRNSTVKILLGQTAADGGNPGPDYAFGWGSARIKDCIDFMRLGNFLEDTLDHQGASAQYTVDVQGGDSELKVMLAWDDEPGTFACSTPMAVATIRGRWIPTTRLRTPCRRRKTIATTSSRCSYPRRWPAPGRWKLPVRSLPPAISLTLCVPRGPSAPSPTSRLDY
jgi:hypothetical protein